MSVSAARVLARLQKVGSDTGSGLAFMLDMPQASVRRCIQELIREGHNITFASGRDGCYRFITPEATYGEA